MVCACFDIALFSNCTADIDGLVSKMSLLVQRIRQRRDEGQFEWVDNVLVKALEYGYWLTITHANFCRYAIETFI